MRETLATASFPEQLMDAKDCNAIGRSSGHVHKDKNVSRFANGVCRLPKENVKKLPCAEGLEKSKITKKCLVKNSDAPMSTFLFGLPNGDCQSKRGAQQKRGGRPRMNNYTFSFRSSECGENSPNRTANKNFLPQEERSNPKNSGGPQHVSNLNSVNWVINHKHSISEWSSLQSLPQLVRKGFCKRSHRTRRLNLSTLTSSHYGFFSLDTANEPISSKNNPRFTRQESSDKVQKIKSKVEQTFTKGLTKSEEIGIADNEPKETSKSEVKINVKQYAQKAFALRLPSRKTKPIYHKDLEYDEQRQIQTVLGSISVGSQLHALDNVATSSQQISREVDSEEAERKCGCLPMKNISEQRKHLLSWLSMNNDSPELSGNIKSPMNYLVPKKYCYLMTVSLFLPGKPIDDKEALLASAEDALDRTSACQNTFWKKIEPVFRYISTDDVTFLNEQDDLKNSPLPDSYSSVTNVISFDESAKDQRLVCQEEQEQLFGCIGTSRRIPLSQVLLSAIIVDEDFNNMNYSNSNKEEDLHDQPSNHGYGSTDALLEARTSLSESEYSQMGLDDRILLELNSIGIYPNLSTHPEQTEDQGVDAELNTLEEELRVKDIVEKLKKRVDEARMSEQRELESIAMDRLVIKAYEKYMASCDPKASGSKAMREHKKNTALGIARQVLTLRQRFEETGVSCFDDPAFKDIFYSFSSCSGDAECIKNRGNEQLSNYISNYNFNSNTRRRTTKMDQGVADGDKSCDGLHSSEEMLFKEQSLSNKMYKRKRKPLLDTVVGNPAHFSSQTPPGLANSFFNITKRKRSRRGQGTREKNKDVSATNNLNYHEAIGQSNLQLLDTDGADVDQGIASWLSIDEEGLKGDDFDGLKVPADDISNLDMPW
ncbi:hypothetical protein Cni_G02427 [Canna indica]|uniref:Uncharacterized protein n=1 Tax=Canna indica TaxID=4628 RepID=A0AAQ3Q2Q9_9LILI|nr:hypothetical protein Cni_G02427 [Canna indica]